MRVQYVGVHVRQHHWVAFVISAACAGLAGALFAFSTGNVFPSWLNWTASATPVVMAVTFVFSALVIACNLIADILYGWLDPRISFA